MSPLELVIFDAGRMGATNTHRAPNQSDAWGIFMADTHPTTKWCRRCSEEKPLSDYYPHPGGKDGHKNICKACFAKQGAEYARTPRARLLANKRRGFVDDEGAVLWRYMRVLRSPRHLWDRNVAPKIIPEPNSGCWLWTGGAYRDRPIVKINGRAVRISRVACVVFHGAPDIFDLSWLACHRCDNAHCVNPDHLYVGDKSTNTADDWRRGTRKAPTHCRKGHELTSDNITLWDDPSRKNPRRRCKICHRRHQLDYLSRRAG